MIDRNDTYSCDPLPRDFTPDVLLAAFHLRNRRCNLDDIRKTIFGYQMDDMQIALDMISTGMAISELMDSGHIGIDRGFFRLSERGIQKALT